MGASSVIGTVLAILIALTTYKGFKDFVYYERYSFNIDGILVKRQYNRLITSGFLHVSWLHFAFNIIALISFSESIVWAFGKYGSLIFLLIYFFSLLGGSLLALYLHRNHGDYSAVGASGAVSGIVFASIFLDPTGKIGFFFAEELSIPSWIFGVLFVIISIWGIKRQSDNIGHEAHLGGALVGLFLMMCFRPTLVVSHWWVVLILVLPSLLFLYLIISNPAVLMIENYWGENIDRFKSRKKKKKSTSKEEELNELLDKIRAKGMKSLTKKERQRLKNLKDL